MRGLAAYAVLVGSVCSLIPWPQYWPAAAVGFVAALMILELSPRNSGGGRARGEGS